jgi:hypothetical protein
MTSDNEARWEQRQADRREFWMEVCGLMAAVVICMVLLYFFPSADSAKLP